MAKKLDPIISRFLAYRHFNKHFLTLLGWSEKYSNKMYRILPYYHLLLSISMAYIIFGFVKVHYKNIPLLTGAMSIMTSFILISLKMTCYLTHRKEVFELHRSLDAHFVDLLKQDHLTHRILEHISRYRFLSIGMAISVFTSVALFLLLPLTTNILNYINQVTPDHYIFVYPSSFPWPIPYSGFFYQLHFFYEALANCTLFILTVGVDILFIYFIFLIIGQIREITYRVSHLDEENDCDIIVKKCMIQYCTLMKCCDTLQRIYGPIVLCLMTTNAIVLCALIYQITQMDSLTVERAVLFAAYISSKTFQTYMYSWCGTHLTIESEEYINAIYACNWYGNRRFMLAMLIMLKSKPLVLTACHFSIVSLEIFIKIAKTTLSYYFLLKTLDN